MYCSECKLRVADDSVVVCPVCQGPLQSETENEAAQVDHGAEKKSPPKASEIKVEDKFIAYEKIDQEFEFSPEDLGLHSLEKEPENSSDDMKVLAELWEDEDIDSDLEGVFAEAFTLDEVDDAAKMDEVSELSADEDVDADLGGALAEAFTLVDEGELAGLEEELNLGENNMEPTRPETIPAAPASVAAPPRKNSSPLLFLLLVVVAGAGALWFYFQSPVVKSCAPVVKSVSPSPSPPPAPVKTVPEAMVRKESGVQKVPKPVAEKVKVSEPVSKAEPDSVEGLEDKPKTEVPVRNEVSLETVESKVSETEKNAAPVTAARVQSSAQSSGALFLEQKSTASVEQSETLISIAEKGKEKTVDLKFSYVVHVGSFKSEKRASRQVARFQKKGFAAYSMEVDLKAKGVWLRVMVPGGATREEAKVVQARVAEVFPKEESLVRKVAK